MENVKLDGKDLKILELLRENAKTTTQQIAKKTLLPVTTVYNRIKKMEKQGVIVGYTVNVDNKKLGKNLLAYVLATVDYNLPSGHRLYQDKLADKIALHPAVEEVHLVTGGTDIIVKARVEDIDALNKFIIRDLREMEGVDKTETLVAIYTANGSNGIAVRR